MHEDRKRQISFRYYYVIFIFGLLVGFARLNSVGLDVKPFLANGENKDRYAVSMAMAMAMAMAGADRVLRGEDASSPITIDDAGTYGLTENLTGTTIVIDADDVTLDLGSHTITCTLTNANAITVNSGKKRISIRNGTVYNIAGPGTGSGVLLQAGVSDVHIDHIKTFNFGVGIKLNGSNGNEVTGCEVIACDMTSNTTGLQLYHADETVIKECVATKNTQAGFELLHSEANCILDCQALNTESNTTVAGFRSDNGSDNLFQLCVTKKTQTSATAFCNKSYGFLLTGTETNTKIIKCIANTTGTIASGNAITYGIALSPLLFDTADLLNLVAANNTPGNDVYSVAWSPDRKYIATGDFGTYVRVFGFDGSTLTHIDGNNIAGGRIVSVAWSPDGKYIATGDYGNYVRVFSFDGTSITYITGSNISANFVDSVSWSPDGRYLAIGDAGNFVRVFSFDGSTLTHIDGNNTAGFAIFSVSWSPGGTYIASGDNNNYVRVFSFDGATLTHISGDNTATGVVISVAWSPGGTYIASGDNGSRVRVFSFNGSTVTHIAENNTPVLAVNSVSWSPDAKYIASGENGQYVRVFNFNGSAILYIDGISTLPTAVNSVTWSPDGSYIASGDGSDYVIVYDALKAPQNCLVDNCRVCDSSAYAQFFGIGIAGGGRNSFTQNICCNNNVNFTFGIPNVYFGSYNTKQPFDNLSMPIEL